MNNINQFINALCEGQGASYSLTQGTPNSGVFASIYGYEMTVPFPDLPTRERISNYVMEFIGNHGVLLEQDNNHIGGWWNNGNLVLDVSKQFDTIEEAAEFGIINRQKAIFSIDLGLEIDLPQPQDAGTETQKAAYAKLAAKKVADTIKEGNNNG